MRKKILAISSIVIVLVSVLVFTIRPAAASAPDSNYWTQGSITVTRNSYSGHGTAISDYLFRFKQEYNYHVTISNSGSNNYYKGYIKLYLPLTIAFTNAHAGNIEFVGLDNTFEISPEIVKAKATSYYISSDYWNGSYSFDLVVLYPIDGMLTNSSFDFTLGVNWEGTYRVNSPNTPSWNYSWSSHNYDWDLKYTESSVDTLQDIKNRLDNVDNGIDGVNNRLDTLNNGNATTASAAAALDQATNDYQAANTAADNAVDSAIHNYSTDLAIVNSADTTSFWANQSLAVLFWRDIGEFILDSRELGFVASGLVIVTLITLFVYLLRL